MIDLFCPGCNHHLRIPNKFAGTSGKCKYCDSHFDVPMEIIETPSDLDSSEPGSGRDDPTGGIGVPGLADNSGASFEDIMVNKEIGGGDVPLPQLDGSVGDPMGLEGAPPISHYAAQSYEAPLGCLFWGTVFFIPPAGLVWAILSPADHSERMKGIIASVIMLLIAVGTLAASFAVASNVELDLDELLAPIEGEYDEAVGGSGNASGGVDIVTSRKTSTAIIEGVPVPAVQDIRFVQTSPTALMVGPFTAKASRSLRFYLATANVDYFELQSEYQTALTDAGWDYEFVAGFDSDVGKYTDMYGLAQGRQVHLRIVENDVGVIVYFITTPE